MTIHIRILRNTYQQIREDLRRPHPFAGERVGFACAKQGNLTGATRLILLTDYFPIPDDQYVDDHESGARIDKRAIRTAMQKALDTKDGIFHVHMHPFPGIPHFGKMDKREIPKLIYSFRAVAPQASHGAFLLSNDACSGVVWTSEADGPVVAAKVSIVGFPIDIFEGSRYVFS